MKYKVGDRVRIRSKEWYDKHKDECGEIRGAFFDKDRAKLCGTIQTIANKGFFNGSGVIIYAVEDAYEFIGEEAIEGLVEELLDNDMEEHQKIVDEIMAIQGIEPIEAEMEEVWHCPEGYIFKDENGNVINARKIVLEKGNKYPKTYEECCKILRIDNSVYLTTDEDGYWNDYELGLNYLIEHFRKLIICRDAYWKIAGEEMGLDGPWEPDYRYKDEYYSIYYNGFGIIQCNSFQAHVFIFPTEEMRNAFYENFKELIEICKELL